MYVAGPIGSTRLAAAPNPFSPDGDGRDDVTRIRYETTGPVTLVRLSLYDIVGRPIRRLLDNAPGVSQGETVWDGRDDQGRIARIGIYIILLECLDERGGTTSGAKGTVVLAGPL